MCSCAIEPALFQTDYILSLRATENSRWSPSRCQPPSLTTFPATKTTISQLRQVNSTAAASGSKAIEFHECCGTSYTFGRNLFLEEMLDLAEPILSSSIIQALVSIARSNRIFILAGLFEKYSDDKIYNIHICIDGNGLFAKYWPVFISLLRNDGPGWVKECIYIRD
jgi:hypothetical protein